MLIDLKLRYILKCHFSAFRLTSLRQININTHFTVTFRTDSTHTHLQQFIWLALFFNNGCVRSLFLFIQEIIGEVYFWKVRYVSFRLFFSLVTFEYALKSFSRIGYDGNEWKCCWFFLLSFSMIFDIISYMYSYTYTLCIVYLYFVYAGRLSVRLLAGLSEWLLNRSADLHWD